MTFDPLTQPCRRPSCRALPGEPCRAAAAKGGRVRPRAHKVRWQDAWSVAAHADPVLNYPSLGPTSGCGLCGVRGLPQRHRVVDSIAALIGAEPDASDEEVAAEFGVTVQAAGAVRAWMGLWPGAWR